MKYHKSVLLKEVVGYLEPKSGDIVLDATFGFGGHSIAILERLGKKGKIIGFEKDPRVFKMVSDRIAKNVVLINDDFVNYRKHFDKMGIGRIDKAIFDLGLSSWHLDKSRLGFSFKGDEELDMRLDPKNSLTAAQILNSYNKSDLSDVFYYLSDEYRARQIAEAIVRKRKARKITRSSELVDIVESVKGTSSSRINPATKVFQALRIEVNQELSSLEKVLGQVIGDLNKEGELAVISFHSKEDKIVKTVFKKYYKKGLVNILTKKPVTPTREELMSNPRSRSAKMRVILRRGK